MCEQRVNVKPQTLVVFVRSSGTRVVCMVCIWWHIRGIAREHTREAHEKVELLSTVSLNGHLEPSNSVYSVVVVIFVAFDTPAGYIQHTVSSRVDNVFSIQKYM